MAQADGDKDNWDDYDRFYSSSHSDDSPLLSRYDKYRRYEPYVREDKTEQEEKRDRRSTLSVLAKFFLFCTSMIFFCVLMYIPVYNKAYYQIPKDKGVVAGWSIHTNRDTKIYVQPNNVTTIHEPKHICPNHSKSKKNDLFLLIIVCSSTSNFERRMAIRETWGNYKNYLKSQKIFENVTQTYKSYNYTYDLFPETANVTNVTDVYNVTRKKREIAGFGQLLPELAKALKNNLVTAKTDTVPEIEEKRFDDDDSMLPEFDMNKELGGQTDSTNYDYEYESNIMKIPPKGFEDHQDLNAIIKQFKLTNTFPKEDYDGNTDPDFKLVFLLGLPSQDNDTEIQSKIEEEVQVYEDVIQEGFIDSYNNLTLKSIMMLKWVTNKCGDSVRYILKTDDDMYINVPNLISHLRNRSKEYEKKVEKGFKDKEYMLIGDLICGARPVLDAHNKWYSPRYMYGGKVYPRYLSGTGYALSAPTAHALYAAALRTHYFHLEDIYITGMCSLRATPRIIPLDSPLFSYRSARPAACTAHAQVTAHHLTAQDMRRVQRSLLDERVVDRCERKRLTQVRRDRMRPKTPPKKKLSKIALALT